MILGNDSSASDNDGKPEVILELRNRISALDLWITHLAQVTGMPPRAADTSPVVACILLHRCTELDSKAWMLSTF